MKPLVLLAALCCGPQLLSQTCYQSSDLLAVVGNYAQPVPEVLPAFSNYYQDVGGGFQTFQVFSLVDGVAWPDLDAATRSEWELFWFKEGEAGPWAVGELPPFNELEWGCDGPFFLTLEMRHTSGLVVARTEPAFVEFVLEDYPECGSEASQGEAGSIVFYPEVDLGVYVTQNADGDLNGDGEVDADDLLVLLGDFCGG